MGDKKQMAIEVMVADKYVLSNHVFRRWKFTYDSLLEFSSPEPDGLSGELPVMKQGIYLRFILPRELRTSEEGKNGFPLIPNRWKITRTGNGTEKSWILESDCPISQSMDKELLKVMKTRSSRYFITEEVKKAWAGSACPFRQNPAVKAVPGGGYFVNVGVFFPAGQWKERAAGIKFLTADAGGNPAFTAYVEHNSNILSFYDDMEGVGNGRHEFIYTVAGWFSDQEEICLEGSMRRVLWNENGLAPGEYQDSLTALKDSRRLNVALGQSPEEALRGYIRQRHADQPFVRQEERDEVLKALFHHFLDYRQAADGDLKLRNTVHDLKFVGEGGGTRYLIVSKEEQEVLLTETEKELLERLNRFEEMEEELSSKREQIFFLWWKRNRSKVLMDQYFIEMDMRPEDYEKALGLEEKSLMRQTVQLYEEVKAAGRNMPHPPDDQDAGEYYRSYGQACGVRTGLVLKAVPGPRYFRGMDPDFLIIGTEPPQDIIETGEEKAPIETEWKQPFAPLFLEWKVTYTHVKFDGTGENWEFDGTDYTLKEDYKKGKSQGYSGISMLDNHQKHILKKTIEEVIEKCQDSSKMEMLGRQAQEIVSWKMTGQEIVNLKGMLAQRDIRAFRRPAGEKTAGGGYLLEELLGFVDSGETFFNKSLRMPDSMPLSWGEFIPDFFETQSGILQITDLVLYDAFGRMLNIVRSGDYTAYMMAENFPFIMPPDIRLRDTNQMILPPRLLQPARLEINFQKQAGDNPVGGYVMAGHLDRSLALFGPDGIMCGRLACRVSEGKRKVCYLPSPMSGQDSLDAVEVSFPLLGRVAKVIGQWKAEEFEIFLDAVDRSIWTMNSPDQKRSNSAWMNGRPLALIQSQIYVKTSGQPWGDIGWNETGGELVSAFYANGKIPVRLGDQYLQNDGLAGYFQAADKEMFYSIARPEANDRIVHAASFDQTDSRWLKTGFGKSRGVEVILLLEPSLSVHVYTGILPVKETDIPKEYTARAMKHIELQFQAGPYISRLVSDGAKIQIPRMPDQDGRWQWLRRQGKQWETLFTVSDSQKAQDTGEMPTIQEGILRYFKEEKQDENQTDGRDESNL